jgi:PBP1b-binding outer membrane lipoprotein LpoB
MSKLLLILALLFTLGCSSTPTTTRQAPARLVQESKLSPVSTPTPSRPAQSATPAPQDARIRGNKRSMIYHWPGCPNYDDIAPHNRVYFRTRAEAEAAGYRAARNCS